MSTSNFPFFSGRWKRARVTPIFQNGDCCSFIYSFVCLVVCSFYQYILQIYFTNFKKQEREEITCHLKLCNFSIRLWYVSIISISFNLKSMVYKKCSKVFFCACRKGENLKEDTTSPDWVVAWRHSTKNPLSFVGTGFAQSISIVNFAFVAVMSTTIFSIMFRFPFDAVKYLE